jgi:hypothetical protein
VVGQPVEFELAIFLASSGPPTRDPRQAARQLAESIPGAVVCYPAAYEREETVTAEEWGEHAFWAHEQLRRQNDDAAQPRASKAGRFSEFAA